MKLWLNSCASDKWSSEMTSHDFCHTVSVCWPVNRSIFMQDGLIEEEKVKGKRMIATAPLEKVEGVEELCWFSREDGFKQTSLLDTPAWHA